MSFWMRTFEDIPCSMVFSETSHLEPDITQATFSRFEVTIILETDEIEDIDSFLSIFVPKKAHFHINIYRKTVFKLLFGAKMV